MLLTLIVANGRGCQNEDFHFLYQTSKAVKEISSDSYLSTVKSIFSL